jgi:hypothetical protein
VREVLTGKGRLQVAESALRPLPLTPFARLLLRAPGRPQTPAEVQQLHDAVANRFEGAWEQAVEYINKRNDRLLNQARGLLTFDGLVLTALGAVYQQSHLISARLVLAGFVCAVLAASVLLLSQLSVHFGEHSKYADAQNEFPSALVQVCLHGKSLLVAGVLSFLALLCLLVSLGIVASKAELQSLASQAAFARAPVGYAVACGRYDGRVKTATAPVYRVAEAGREQPHVRWRGRGARVTAPPMPIPGRLRRRSAQRARGYLPGDKALTSAVP